ncbi:MAG: prolyl oligopeptidase family serine peptidase [Verrucomicrobiota bacterium]
MKTSFILALLLVFPVAAAEKAAPKAPAKASTKAKASLPPNPKKLGPPPGIAVPAEVKAELKAGVEVLGRQIESLPAALKNSPLLELMPDAEIFYNAVKYALEDDIFYSTNQFNTARNLLKLGSLRALQLQRGQAPWTTAVGPVVRGYRSKLDGSAQPYGLIVPAGFKPGGASMRLDFWLHGRGDTLNELAFLEGRLKGTSEFVPAEAFVLHPYGRFMNAFKFAGEVDVFEAMEHAIKHYNLDRNKIAMRGFSMGGAGAWHLGAHHADKFAAVNPGAGFVDVKNYQKLGDKLDTIPWYEQKLWNLYDPLACPINLANTALVAYSGEEDAQKAAADLMEAALAKDGVKMTHIIGPKTGHKYEPEAKKVVARLVDGATNRGRNPSPAKVSFVTYSLKYNQMHWVTIDAMEKHWEPARVDAEITAQSVKVTTRNVAAITLSPQSRATRLAIDGKDFGIALGSFRKDNGIWNVDAGSVASVATPPLAKRHNLQGPIDDAFMDSFIMVRPTGQPLNAQAGKWADAEMKDAVFQWRRFFRGPARVKDDGAIDDDDIANNNLILWGDPSSNKVLARIADRLPIKWTARGIVVDGKTYDATKHAPVFIYPNPLNPSRYVVINSGFTFPQFASTTNSQQTPKLPDWAILDLSVPVADRVHGKGVVAADFFGEKWEIVKK